MLKSYLTLLLLLTTTSGLALVYMSVARPVWGEGGEQQMKAWIARLESGDWRRCVVWSLKAIHIAKNALLWLAAIEYERSRVLAPGVAVVIGLLIPFAAVVNAVLGGSPMMFYCYAGCLFGIACLGVADAFGLKQPGIPLAILTSFVWGVALPIYAVWTLTEHFMGGLLQNAVVAGLIIGFFLYAVLAVAWSMFRSDRTTNDDDAYGVGAVTVVVVPVLYVAYWLVLLAASAQGLDVGDRNWFGLGVFIVVVLFFLATLNQMLNHWRPSGSQLGACGLYLGSAILAGMSSFAIIGSGDPDGMAAWLSFVPVAIWMVLPLTLIGIAMIKVAQTALGGIGALKVSAFSAPAVAMLVSSAGLFAAIAALS